MSTGTRLPHAAALDIAKRVVDELQPVVNLVKVAGSIRRRRPEVGDIEIVCAPRLHPPDLFGEIHADSEAVRRVVATFGEILKGGDKYVQAQLPEGIRLDLFMVTPPADWYVILAIRTGPARLGQWAVTQMHGHGYRCSDGYIQRTSTGERVTLESEADFFRCAGLSCYRPHQRDLPAAMQPIAATLRPTPEVSRHSAAVADAGQQPGSNVNTSAIAEGDA